MPTPATQVLKLLSTLPMVAEDVTKTVAALRTADTTGEKVSAVIAGLQALLTELATTA